MNPAIGEAILKHAFDFVEEVIATQAEILIKLNASFLQEHLSLLEQVKIEQPSVHKTYELPVCFTDDYEWDDVVKMSKMTKQAFIDTIVASELSVAMFGFIPGFIYVNGLPAQLHCPRKSTPTNNKYARALALGGPYLGIYNYPSPAGWYILGQVGVHLMDKESVPPTQLNPLDKLKIKVLNKTDFEQLEKRHLSLLEYNEQT